MPTPLSTHECPAPLQPLSPSRPTPAPLLSWPSLFPASRHALASFLPSRPCLLPSVTPAQAGAPHPGKSRKPERRIPNRPRSCPSDTSHPRDTTMLVPKHHHVGAATRTNHPLECVSPRHSHPHIPGWLAVREPDADSGPQAQRRRFTDSCSFPTVAALCYHGLGKHWRSRRIPPGLSAWGRMWQSPAGTGLPSCHPSPLFPSPLVGLDKTGQTEDIQRKKAEIWRTRPVGNPSVPRLNVRKCPLLSAFSGCCRSWSVYAGREPRPGIVSLTTKWALCYHRLCS